MNMKKLNRELNELYLENSDRLELDLSEQNISNLNDILARLLQFTKLKSLNLSKNRLRTLPSDLGRLENLEILNLQTNDFENSQPNDILPGLMTLPHLRHLFITVPSTVEDRVISSLPALQTFNGAQFFMSEYSDDPTKTIGDQLSEHDKLETASEEIVFSHDDPDYDHVMELFTEINRWTRKNEDFLSVVKAKKTRLGVVNYCMDEVIEWFSPGDKDTPRILTLLRRNYNAQLDREGEARRQAEFLLGESEKAKRELHLTFETLEQQYVSEIADLKSQLERHKHYVKQSEMKFFTKPLLQTSVTPREVLLRNLLLSRKNSRKLRQSPIKKKKTGYFKQISFTKLVDTIHEICGSKEKYDLICKKNRLPRLTMERFFYRFLNQKFGIKAVVLEWSRSIHRGIKKYGPVNNDIYLFGLILKNEVDEEFRYVQKQLKETVCELLRAYLKEKLPMKREIEINKLLERKKKGFVYEEEWVDIVKYMYNKSDSKKVIRNVRESIREMSDEIRVSQYKIRYERFVQVLLNFQLKGHQNFLEDFVKIFRSIDKDKNGIVNEYEFVMLIRNLNPQRTEREVRNMLKKIDPFENSQITFSECISFLSSEDGKKELIRMMNEKQRRIKRKQLDHQLKKMEVIDDNDDDDDDDDDLSDDDEEDNERSFMKADSRGLLDDDDDDSEDDGEEEEEEEEGESGEEEEEGQDNDDDDEQDDIKSED